MVEPQTETTTGMRVVAVFEGAKGVVVLLAGFGLLTLLHHNLQMIGEEIVGFLHLNPASRSPRIFLSLLSSLDDARIWALAAGAFAYAGIRFAEAWGLWRHRAWAEWFGIISGGIYLPLELYELARRVTVVRGTVFLINLAIVVWLVRVRMGEGGDGEES